MSRALDRIADALGSKVVWGVFFFLLLSAMIVPWALYGSMSSSSMGMSDNPPMAGFIRTYYVAANEVEWDYVPDMQKAINVAKNEDLAEYATNGPNRIGTKYKKVLYEEYIDDHFRTKKNRTEEWAHLGFLGPIIRASVGDSINFVFKNNAKSLSFSVHPHGVLYHKASEGVTYADSTCTQDQKDGMVAPHQKYTYKWVVPERAGPGPNDPDSVIWLYHSHVNEIMDTNAGLIGAIIITRLGTSSLDARPNDVDREVVTMFTAANENISWYLDDNINRYCADANSTNSADAAFMDSNVKYSINGYMFGNMPGLNFNQGDRVRWYVIGMGTEMDIHSPGWEGHTVTANGRRIQSYEIIPAEQKTFDMVASNPGTWQLVCGVTKHRRGGMQATFTVQSASNALAGLPFREYTGRNHTFYIAAVEVEWDYVPSGANNITGRNFSTPLQYRDVFGDGNNAMGRKARKAVFREYTDSTFTQQRVRPEWSHLGLVGPVIRAQVGDTVVVFFKNLATRPYNMFPSGLISSNSSDRFAGIQPGASHTYIWYATSTSGPAGERDLSSIAWMYRSYVDAVGDGYAGLIGPIVVVDPEQARADLSPRDVDRELVTLFAVFDETQSPYLKANVAQYLPSRTGVLADDYLYDDMRFNDVFINSNLKHSINGYAYGNVPGLDVTEGQRVRWYVMSIGDESGLHTPQWYGNVVYWNGGHVSVVEMLPGTTKTVDMNADSPGTWPIKCQVFKHMERGMEALYNVVRNPDLIDQEFRSDRVRTYYIAAEEVEFNYAPSGLNGLSGEAFNEEQQVFTLRGPDRIGSVYRKAIYREYTSASFGTRKAVPSQWEHLGLVGPVIRAEVGDTIMIYFKNMASRPYSMSARGVSTRDVNNSQPVLPNEMHLYKWTVPQRSGPARGDSSSVLWLYRSDVNDNDIYAGLFGPLIITAAGKAKADATPVDVDREFVLSLFVSNENLSPYLDFNIQKYCKSPSTVVKDDGFQESNMMHTINGRVYGNLLGLNMTLGDRVRWYVMALGNEVDIHGAHFHGNTYISHGHKSDSEALLPSSTHVLDMLADNPGIWLFHCHINDHISAGMVGVYRVQSKEGNLPACGSRRRRVL